ncbi:MauE/DoxX family redox-associated membrane protein [Dawidia soli]|uniref:Methylamine utilisation protein MauE domain-containing protein n=1 Tax=Dawidia soli TaxID=2782352 RepID=A0AAP2DC28_9BACT|nr:MauE/DoxX family redox-associated membrane protein [Dawidia soli]MBT1689234.1 hypothetical protein [Dawidia soli]
MKTKTITDAINILFILLFIYASVSKLMEYEVFKAQIGRSPFIMKYTDVIAWLIPALEILIAILLFFPKLSLLGLYGSFSIMLLFTLYIVIILKLSPYVPCSCGGILNDMGWGEHLVFNIAFTILALVGIMLQVKDAKRKLTLTNAI